MDNAQLMKGVLEGCVLSIVARGETYGYEILSVLDEAGFEALGEGTLYPVLTRLDKNGLIVCRKAKSPLGPIRKYYSVTEKGRQVSCLRHSQIGIGLVDPHTAQGASSPPA